MEPSPVSYFIGCQVLIIQTMQLNKQNLGDTYHSDEKVIVGFSWFRLILENCHGDKVKIRAELVAISKV